ncbi:MAG: 50S ribosomal protein L29 [Bdellovibrionota bacterium]|jgi:large subunit ribosomal protein L29
MKKRDYLKGIRELTEEGLRERIRTLSEERMKLRFRAVSGQLNETHRIGEVRRELAQAKTVYSEKFCQDSGM